MKVEVALPPISSHRPFALPWLWERPVAESRPRAPKETRRPCYSNGRGPCPAVDDPRSRQLLDGWGKPAGVRGGLLGRSFVKGSHLLLDVDEKTD